MSGSGVRWSELGLPSGHFAVRDLWRKEDVGSLVYTQGMVKQLIVELDDALARELERVAPARTRQRSSFVRAAVRRALDELAEARMREAYAATPDTEPAYFDPRVWEVAERRKTSRRKRR